VPEWAVTALGSGQVRICDPSFQPIDRLGRAKTVIALPPCPRCLDRAEKGVEMIGAGIVAKAVGCDYAEAVTPWCFLAESLEKIPAGLVLIGGLLFSRIVLVAAATDKPAGEQPGIGFDGYAERIAVV